MPKHLLDLSCQYLIHGSLSVKQREKDVKLNAKVVLFFFQRSLLNKRDYVSVPKSLCLTLSPSVINVTFKLQINMFHRVSEK